MCRLFKSFLFTGIFVFFFNFVFSQYGALSLNNVEVNVSGNDVFFLPGYNFQTHSLIPGYQVPKGSGKGALSDAAIWISGLDNGGQLRIAAMMKNAPGYDFCVGPINNGMSGGGCAYCLNASNNNIKYNEIWELHTAELDSFLNNHVASYDILNWPGNGDANCGVTTQLAPYNDLNSNGIYEPLAGDYPVMRGNQMLYWIMNDKAVHEATNGLGLNIEVNCSAYAYHCYGNADSLRALENTTFYHFKITSHSTTLNDTLHDAYLSFYIDPDLGNGKDDRIGTNVKENFIYCFNDSIPDSVYNSNKMILSVVQLKGPLADANDGINNDRDSVYSGGIATGPLIDEPGEECIMNNVMWFTCPSLFFNNCSATSAFPAPMLLPSNAAQYYEYQRNRWRDGTHLTYGGTGYSTTGGTNCSYAFPGNSDPSGYGTNFSPQPSWTELNAGVPANDRKILLNCGPFTFYHGREIEAEYAIIFSHDTSVTWNSPSFWNSSVNDVRQIKSMYYNNGFPGCKPPPPLPVTCATNVLFPNPSSDHVSLYGLDPSVSTTINIYDNLGKVVMALNPGIINGVTLDVSKLAVGIYYLEIISNNKKEIKKLIKL